MLLSELMFNKKSKSY